MNFMCTPANFPDNAVRAELHLSGPADTAKHLHDLIVEIETPFDSYEESDGFVLIYTSPDIAKKVFNKLHDTLYKKHPELIGHPDGFFVEDDILYFRGCEIFMWE